MPESTLPSEPVAHVDDLRLAIGELLDGAPASVAEIHAGLVRHCGYGTILEVADVLEALDDLGAWGWVRRRPSEARPGESCHEITGFGRRSCRVWREESSDPEDGRWSLDHDPAGNVLCILADRAETAERVLRWWKRMNPHVAFPEESKRLREIGAFRSRSGARAGRGVRLVCQSHLLC